MKMAYTDLPTIGDTILAWREFRELRPTELAKLAGISKGYLSAVEHNKRVNPQLKYLEKIADALDVPLEDILGRRMPPKKRDRKRLKRATGPMPSPKQPAAPLPTIAHPAIALPDSLLDAAYERIEAIIETKRFSEEETERFVAGLIEAAELLSKAIRPQRKSKSKRRVRL